MALEIVELRGPHAQHDRCRYESCELSRSNAGCRDSKSVLEFSVIISVGGA